MDSLATCTIEYSLFYWSSRVQVLEQAKSIIWTSRIIFTDHMCQVLRFSHLVFHNNPLREFPYSRVPTFKKKKRKRRIQAQRSKIACLRSHNLAKVGAKMVIQCYSTLKPQHLTTATQCSVLLKIKLCVNENLR